VSADQLDGTWRRSSYSRDDQRLREDRSTSHSIGGLADSGNIYSGRIGSLGPHFQGAEGNRKGSHRGAQQLWRCTEVRRSCFKLIGKNLEYKVMCNRCGSRIGGVIDQREAAVYSQEPRNRGLSRGHEQIVWAGGLETGLTDSIGRPGKIAIHVNGRPGRAGMSRDRPGILF